LSPRATPAFIGVTVTATDLPLGYPPGKSTSTVPDFCPDGSATDDVFGAWPFTEIETEKLVTAVAAGNFTDRNNVPVRHGRVLPHPEPTKATATKVIAVTTLARTQLARRTEVVTGVRSNFESVG
jgi:hypothetical protein